MTLVVIQIRSSINAKKEVGDTLKMLHLHHVNNCTIIPQTKSYRGMLQKIKDYITWGEINNETLKELITAKRIPFKNNIDTTIKDLMDQKKKLRDITDPPIRLHPPQKGYENVKKPYTMGGSLGYRGSEINELLKRMLA